MKIGIIGLGAVGSGNKEGFEYLGHEVSFHDPAYSTSINNILECAVVYICVPTPSAEDASCDISIVQSVLKELDDAQFNGCVAIRSTIVPGTTDKLIKLFPKLNISFVPEFLRERFTKEDFIENHHILAIGTHCDKTFELIKKSHGNLPKNVAKMKPAEAEILKYFNNVYASLRIIFANNFYEISKKFNANYSLIKDTYIKTGKATDMYLDVDDNLRGYAGMCLPKDTKAIAKLIKDLGLNLKLIEAIETDNQKFKPTVFEGMRK